MKQEKRTEWIQVRVDKTTKEKLKKECQKRGISQSQLILDFVNQKLEDFNPHKQTQIQYQ